MFNTKWLGTGYILLTVQYAELLLWATYLFIAKLRKDFRLGYDFYYYSDAKVVTKLDELRAGGEKQNRCILVVWINGKYEHIFLVTCSWCSIIARVSGWAKFRRW
jgi:hypothetical protein